MDPLGLDSVNFNDLDMDSFDPDDDVVVLDEVVVKGIVTSSDKEYRQMLRQSGRYQGLNISSSYGRHRYIDDASNMLIDEGITMLKSLNGLQTEGVSDDPYVVGGAVQIPGLPKVGKLWQLTHMGASKIAMHPRFGKFFKSASDGTWWCIDRAGHGGSKFKVYKEVGNKLEWIADADAYGNYIVGKHKSDVGKVIEIAELIGVK